MNEKLNELETRLNKLEDSLKWYYEGQIRMFMGMAEPCPHCGSTDLLLNYVNDNNNMRYFVLCNGCKAASGAHEAEHDAITAWNARSIK
jgi:Lar family restriction alleviation protein